MPISWSIAFTVLLCASEGHASTPRSALAEIDAGSSIQVRANPKVAWDKIEAVRILPTRFELDAKIHRRQFDSRSRRTVDQTLSKSDRAHLKDAFTSALSRTMDGEIQEKVEDAVADGTLLLQPVLISARWTRPPPHAYTVNSYLDPRSVRAGGVTVRTDAFLVKDGKRQLVASVDDRWRGNLGDGLARIGIWDDADRGFRTVSRRLRSHLKDLGLERD